MATHTHTATLSQRAGDSGSLSHPAPHAAGGGYAALVRHSDAGAPELTVLIEGAHCGACIQKIESRLLAEPDVTHARLNFSTRRLQLIWHGGAARADALVQAVEQLGYRVHPLHSDRARDTQEEESRFLLLCLGVAGFATGNIMMLSVGVWASSGETMGMATRDFLHLLAGLIAIPAVLFSGQPFFRSAWRVLRKGRTNMDVPISLALLLASGMSVVEALRGAEHVYFDAAAMLAFFLLIGRYLDVQARRQARSAATDLLQSLHGFATVLTGSGPQRLLIQDLRPGMSLAVAVGEAVPVDAVVRQGESALDTSIITGETMPRPARVGDSVYGGTINLSAPLTVEVLKPAEDSLLADVVRLMDKAGQAQARYVRLADRAARLYTPVVHTLALLGFMLWWQVLGAPAWDALMIAVTILIITCPCALGLVVPVVQVLATGRLMKRGVLVKAGDALERLANIDTIIFDKTGTLTLGKPQLQRVPDEDALNIAAALATHSRHPLAQALLAAAPHPLVARDVYETAGQGLEGCVNGQTLRLGSRAWCGVAEDAPASGPEIWLARPGMPPQLFGFTDPLRQDAREIVQALHAEGLRTILLSGDREETVQDAARQLGIDQALAAQTPVQKFAFLQQLKAQGHKVLMVGDGLNDTPVLAGADVSMAPGTAMDMAQNAADMVFMGAALAPVHLAYRVARKATRLVKENFFLAALYNVIAIPIAFLGWVTPMIAALAMSGSSLIVIANAFRLRRLI